MVIFIAWCTAACALVGTGVLLKNERIMMAGGVMVLASCAFAG